MSYTLLPEHMLTRYEDWHRADYQSQQELLADLVDNGQHPEAMLISCCDSRMNVTSIFKADPGDFFVHRNIANLVPPYAPGMNNHGTSAAIEYAVTVLEVSRIIVMGHSQCGGVKGCHDMCSGNAPELENRSSFVGHWLEVLRPAFDRVAASNTDHPVEALEQEGIRVSIENLMTFPFVSERVNASQLELHGLWHDIRSGRLEALDPQSGAFEVV
ncbi:MAG: carbonic anhydrase [Pseudomonadota bacterium]